MSDTNAEIANRAYAIWEQEGRPNDRDLHHWLRAEAEFATTQVASLATEEGPAKPNRPTLRRAKR